uniref:Uncharacterized protein n=1 Tax=Periophthalmus magnuspinnatus TaxID=409849 RepID=A0A3B4AE35_9GOBI
MEVKLSFRRAHIQTCPHPDAPTFRCAHIQTRAHSDSHHVPNRAWAHVWLHQLWLQFMFYWKTVAPLSGIAAVRLVILFRPGSVLTLDTSRRLAPEVLSVRWFIWN